MYVRVNSSYWHICPAVAGNLPLFRINIFCSSKASSCKLLKDTWQSPHILGPDATEGPWLSLQDHYHVLARFLDDLSSIYPFFASKWPPPYSKQSGVGIFFLSSDSIIAQAWDLNLRPCNWKSDTNHLCCTANFNNFMYNIETNHLYYQ